MNSNGTAVAVAPSLPFPLGALERHEGPVADKSALLAAGVSTTLDTIDIPAGGFLRSVWLRVSTSGSAGAATFAADGPWSAIQEVVLMDPDGTPVLGPISGYELMLINQLGGYSGTSDIHGQPGYTADTGSGAFGFLLQIPIEIIGRDAIGALRNGASNSTLKLRVTLAPLAQVYSAGPATTPPTVRVRAWSDIWVRPQAGTSPLGRTYADRPFGDGAYQMWTRQQFPLANGLNVIQQRRVGNFIREMILITRTNAGARDATLISPDQPVRLMYEGNELLSDDTALLRHLMWDRTQLPKASLQSGVYLYDWCHEFDGVVGSELRLQWLPTTPGTRLEFQVTTSAPGSLIVLTNDVYIPAGSELLH